MFDKIIIKYQYGSAIVKAFAQYNENRNPKISVEYINDNNIVEFNDAKYSIDEIVSNDVYEKDCRILLEKISKHILDESYFNQGFEGDTMFKGTPIPLQIINFKD